MKWRRLRGSDYRRPARADPGFPGPDPVAAAPAAGSLGANFRRASGTVTGIAVGIMTWHCALLFVIIVLLALNRARPAHRRRLHYEEPYRTGPAVPPGFPADTGAVGSAERRALWLAHLSEQQARQRAYEKDWLKRLR